MTLIKSYTLNNEAPGKAEATHPAMRSGADITSTGGDFLPVQGILGYLAMWAKQVKQWEVTEAEYILDRVSPTLIGFEPRIEWLRKTMRIHFSMEDMWISRYVGQWHEMHIFVSECISN